VSANSSEPELIRDLVEALYVGLTGAAPNAATLDYWRHSGRSPAAIAAAIVAALRPAGTTENPHGAKIFAPPGHFYSPIAEPGEAAEAIARAQAWLAAPGVPGVRLDREAMLDLWRELLPMFAAMPFPEAPSNGFRYGSRNDFYSGADGAVYSAMVRKFRPAKIIETGCGWSSACLVDTLERTPDLACDVTFVEPYPHRLRELLGESLSRFRLIEKRIQDVPIAEFESLAANDILFLDSTHVLKAGSDVGYELFEIFPRLKSGVIVHIHDIHWPFEYIPRWVLEDNRSWNELYAYRAFLTHNNDWDILMFVHYVLKTAPEVWPANLTPGGGLWLRKR